MLVGMTDQSVSERKRTAILCAARAVFSRKGYAEASVDDVAEEARIAKGTLYLYFKSKEDLYLAALANDLRALAGHVRDEMERAHGFREKIRAFLRVRLEYCKSHEDFLRIYLAEYGSIFVKAAMSRELWQLLRENLRYVASVFEQAVRRGEIRPVPAGAMAAALVDVSRGLMERRLLGWKEFRAPDEIDFAVDVLCSSLARRGRCAPAKRPRRRFHRVALVLLALALGPLMRAQFSGSRTSGDSTMAEQLPLSGRLGQPQGAYQASVPAALAAGSPLAMSLDEAIRRGLEYNLGSRSFEQDIRQAQGQRLTELAKLMPNVTSNLVATEQQTNLAVYGFKFSAPGFSIPTVVGPYHYFDLRGRVTQAVANLTALRNYRASQQTLKALEYSAQDARDLVVLAVTDGYLDVVASAARVESVRAQVATAQATYQQAVDRHTNGLAARIDVTRSQVELQTQQQRLTAAETDLAKQRIQLGRAIGLPPAQEFNLTDELPYTPLTGLALDQALARANANRPDLKAAHAQVVAAELARKAALSERYPSVELDGDYGVIGPSPQNSHGTFNLTGTVSFPVWQGGRVRGDVEQAEAALRQRRLEYEDLRGRVDADIRQAFLDLTAARSLVAVAESSRGLAQETLSQARDRFASGVADTIEVIQAQEAVAAAEQDYINGLFAHNLAKASLARAMGQADQGVQQLLEVR